MNTALRLITCIAITLAIALTWGTGFANTSVACNSEFVIQQATVFTVMPTGENDTVNLQCAFDAAVAAGPGSTVRLVQGTYWIDHEISVVNFDGSFVGAGKQKTIIQNIDTVPFPIQGGPYYFQNWPGLFVFYQDEKGVPSSISISDLTFRALGTGDTVWGNMNILEIYGKHTGVRDNEISYVNTSIIRVGFEGQSNPYAAEGYNVLNMVLISGEFVTRHCRGSLCVEYAKQISGNHLLQDCTFENAVYGYGPLTQLDSRIEVSNSTFKNVLMSIDVEDASRSTVDIQRNTIENAGWVGVLMLDGVWNVRSSEPSQVFIGHNKISITGDGDGIGIIDRIFLLGKSKFKNVTISQNDIQLNNPISGAIFGRGVSGLSVLNNTITGFGGIGIYAGLWNDPVSDWVLVGNNLQNAWTEWPRIFLGPTTSGFTVVGGSNSANVLDLGTNNVITGLSVSHDAHLGQRIQEAMSGRKNLTKRLR